MPEPELELLCFVKVSHPAIARVLCAVPGLTGLIFDAEHGAFSEPDLEALCALTNLAGRLSVIRTPSPTPDAVTRALDRGARGVMIPRVKTVEETELATRGLRYAPGGLRGYDPTISAEDYGSARDGAAAGTPRLFVQIETRAALDNVGAIGRVPGVTDVFVGPADLARDLGAGADVFSDQVLDAMRRVAAACAGAGARLSAFVDGPERAGWAAGLGYESFAVGSDVTFMQAGSTAVAAFAAAVDGRVRAR